MYAGAVWSADYFCAAVWVNVVGGDSLRPTTISALFCLHSLWWPRKIDTEDLQHTGYPSF